MSIAARPPVASARHSLALGNLHVLSRCRRAHRARDGALFSSTAPGLSHGVVGNRFFPATIATDDPFVADELSLPTVSHQKTGTDPSVKETDINGEYSKRITPDIGFSFGDGLDPSGPARPAAQPERLAEHRVGAAMAIPDERAARSGGLGGAEDRIGRAGRKTRRGRPLHDLYADVPVRKGGGRSPGNAGVAAASGADRHCRIRDHVDEKDAELRLPTRIPAKPQSMSNITRTRSCTGSRSNTACCICVPRFAISVFPNGPIG